MEIDRVDEALDVAEAVSFPLDRFNFVVYSFGDGVGRPQFEKRRWLANIVEAGQAEAGSAGEQSAEG